MNTEKYPEDAQVLCDLCHLFGDRGWCRATSGNFSVRIDGSHCLITESGCDKSRLTTDDLMVCDLQGQATDPARQPSAETLIHTCLYQLDESIGAILHTHSVCSTLLSIQSGSTLTITGFEMQKALASINSHEEKISVPVFANSQDMGALAKEIVAAWNEERVRVPGFLIAGHGLYAWGKDAASAQRHTEGFEFLFECLWQQRLVRSS